jgi:polysaccharide pyruvyl transferase WcaK-like protein
MLKNNIPSVVLLVGDTSNIGDAFIAITEARQLLMLGFRVHVLTYSEAAPDIKVQFEAEGVQILSIRYQSSQAFLVALGSHIFIGGGHAIREGLSHGWLVFAVIVSLLAQVAGRKVRVIGAGVSSIKSLSKRLLIKMLLRQCEAIYVRDLDSLKNVQVLRKDSYEVGYLNTDIAFLHGSKFLNNSERTGICVISPAIDAMECRWGDATDIFEALQPLIDKNEVNHVIFVPHDKLQDVEFCAKMQGIIHQKFRITTDLVCADSIENGLLRPYRQADHVITGRLHGLIVGALMGCTVHYTQGSASKLKPFADLFGFASTLQENSHCLKMTNVDIGHVHLLEDLRIKALKCFFGL